MCGCCHCEGRADILSIWKESTEEITGNEDKGCIVCINQGDFGLLLCIKMHQQRLYNRKASVVMKGLDTETMTLQFAGARGFLWHLMKIWMQLGWMRRKW